jgi:hypothetical protein
VAIPTAEEFLGFPVGADRQMADWGQMCAYFRHIAKETDRMRLEEVGRTTEGRPFICLTIAAPEVLADLETYRGIQKRLADPRGLAPAEAEALIARGKAVVLHTCAIHATEIAASQATLESVHELLTRDDPDTRLILENVIYLLVPSLNPDGQDLVASWYRKTLGTPAEGSSPPQLYHKYTGHDNNRDWFMHTQAETRHCVAIQNAWHPHVVLDQHQMGQDGPRLFVPPFIDPYEPNIDPLISQQTNALGTSMAAELTLRGKRGVTTSVIYDAFTPARAYMNFHHGVRILTEAASCRIATPVDLPREKLRAARGFDPHTANKDHPLPWPGGTWRLRDLCDYQKIAARAVLEHAARFRARWVRGSYEIARRAVSRTSPYAYILPLEQRDPGAAAELCDVLRRGLVEIHAAAAPFTADGVTYPAGTRVVLLAQPFGAYAKALLERQTYPDLREYPGGPPKNPYDITAHTLPLLLGVSAVRADAAFAADLRLLPDAEAAAWPGAASGPDSIPAAGGAASATAAAPASPSGWYAVPAGTNAAYRFAFARLAARGELWRSPAGDFLVRDPALAGGAPGCPARPLDAAPDLAGAMRLRLPRIGVYRSHAAPIDEGWLRFVLEGFAIPYRTLCDRDVRGGALDGCDVLVIPSQGAAGISRGLSGEVYPAELAGGLGDLGTERILAFAERGGTVLAVDQACAWAIPALKLPAVNVLEGLAPNVFFIPGSLLQVLVDTAHPLGMGLPRRGAVLFVRGPAFELREGHAVARFASAGTLLSGWALGIERLADRAAVADIPVGQGRVVLLAFSPHFRAQSRASYPFLFNALLRSAAATA